MSLPFQFQTVLPLYRNQWVHQACASGMSGVASRCLTSPNRYSDVEIVPGISDHDAVCVTYLERVNRNR